MAFVAGRFSVALPATVATIIALPQLVDLSGNAQFGGCLYAHWQVTGGAAVTAAVVFDSLPGTTFNVGGATGATFAVPPDAKSVSVTPSAIASFQLGISK